MIDSIHIRLHNIHNYPNLLDFLINYSQQKSHSAEVAVSNNKPMLNFNLKYEIFEVRGKQLTFAKGEKVTSSHYSLGWSLPLGGKLDFVEFNFSIPKFLYGTNVLQFIEHSDEFQPPCHIINFSDYKANQENTYLRLRYFIRQFLNHCISIAPNKVSMHDVEIRRIDLCWNQMFNSKHDALEYLSYQKLIRKKHARYNSKNMRSFDTSVFFSTRDYACKIYHKGSEYESAKGEKKKHIEANKDMQRERNALGKMMFPTRNIRYDVDKIQAFADRILRYEVTFRNAYLSKLFWAKVFRRKNEDWKRKMKRFKEVKRIYDFSVSEKLTPERKQFYVDVFQGHVDPIKYAEDIKSTCQNYLYIDLKTGCAKNDRKFFRWWLKQRQRRVSLRMAVSEETAKVIIGSSGNLDTSLIDSKTNLLKEAMFSRSLLKCCFKVLNDFRDYFEIKEKTYISDAAKRVAIYNENVKKFNEDIAPHTGEPKKKVILTGKIKSTLTLLQTYSLEELVQKGIICRTTAHYYKKKFAELDINFHTGSKELIPNCRGFSEYHQSLYMDGMARYLKNPVFH